MNLRTIVIASISVVFGMSIANTPIHLTGAQLPDGKNEKNLERLAPQVGRYQIASSDAEVFVVDTVTGECWIPKSAHWERVAPSILESRR